MPESNERERPDWVPFYDFGLPVPLEQLLPEERAAVSKFFDVLAERLRTDTSLFRFNEQGFLEQRFLAEESTVLQTPASVHRIVSRVLSELELQAPSFEPYPSPAPQAAVQRGRLRIWSRIGGMLNIGSTQGQSSGQELGPVPASVDPTEHDTQQLTCLKEWFSEQVQSGGFLRAVLPWAASLKLLESVPKPTSITIPPGKTMELKIGEQKWTVEVDLKLYTALETVIRPGALLTLTLGATESQRSWPGHALHPSLKGVSLELGQGGLLVRSVAGGPVLSSVSEGTE
jgi:hypothetical protein